MGTESLSHEFLRPLKHGEHGATGLKWALAGIRFLGQLWPSVPEHGRSRGMAGLDTCLHVTRQVRGDSHLSMVVIAPKDLGAAGGRGSCLRTQAPHPRKSAAAVLIRAYLSYSHHDPSPPLKSSQAPPCHQCLPLRLSEAG